MAWLLRHPLCKYKERSLITATHIKMLGLVAHTRKPVLERQKLETAKARGQPVSCRPRKDVSKEVDSVPEDDTKGCLWPSSTHSRACTHITTKAQFNQKQPLITALQAMARATAPGQCASVPGCSGGGGRTLVCSMNFPLNFST